jgi:hypothetical protein
MGAVVCLCCVLLPLAGRLVSCRMSTRVSTVAHAAWGFVVCCVTWCACVSMLCVSVSVVGVLALVCRVVVGRDVFGAVRCWISGAVHCLQPWTVLLHACWEGEVRAQLQAPEHVWACILQSYESLLFIYSVSVPSWPLMRLCSGAHAPGVCMCSTSALGLVKTSCFLKQCARKSLGICFRCTREHSGGNALIVSAIGRRTPATVLGAPGWSCEWVSE